MEKSNGELIDKQESFPFQRKYIIIGSTLVLSVILTIAFVFTSIVLGTIVGRYFLDNVMFDPWIRAIEENLTDQDYLIMKREYLELLEIFKAIGIISLLLLVILIIVGILASRYKISVFGSVLLHLPTFSQFAFKMYFFSGAGILTFLWHPLFELSPELLRLGEIIYAPIVLGILINDFIPESLDILIGGIIIGYPIILLVVGMFFFLCGTITWLYGRFNAVKLIDFWIYKYSRHPQYLGILFITWGQSFFLSLGGFWSPFTPPSTFMLLFSLFMIGLVFQDEKRLVEKYEDQYIAYQQQTSILFPLPKQIRRMFRRINLVLIKKENPTRNREILVILIIYGMIAVILSAILVLLYPVQHFSPR